ncbi:hypothetical protein [Streptomyces sp. NPDC002913]
MAEPRGGNMAERDAAGVRLMHDALVRWRDAPPVRVTLDRRDAWTVLLALQAAVTHPGLASSSWAPPLVTVGRQIQEAACDDAEIYATAERGWPGAGSETGPLDPGAEPEPAQLALMADAFTRWATAPPVTAAAERRDIWAVMMGLQVAMTHPGIGETSMGRIVESVGRQLQEALCDTPELYALAESGWDRRADVEQGEGR